MPLAAIAGRQLVLVFVAIPLLYAFRIAASKNVLFTEGCFESEIGFHTTVLGAINGTARRFSARRTSSMALLARCRTWKLS
jgi:hypothetical protein